MNSICRVAVMLLALLKLVSLLVKYDLGLLMFAVILIILITGLPLMGPGFRNITAFFGIAGTAMLLQGGHPLSFWALAFNSMTSVIAILVIMQLFSVPMEAGRYNLAVQYWLQKSVTSAATLFLVTTALTHVLASFLMFGSIPVMVSMLSGMLEKSVANYRRFISVTASRGYVLASLWAPGAINLLLVAQATGARWLDLVIPGFLLAMIGIITSYLLEIRQTMAQAFYQGAKTDLREPLDEEAARRKAWIIGLAIISLLGLTAAFEKLNMGDSSDRIALAGAFVSAVWICSVRKQPGFSRVMAEYWRSGVLKSTDVSILFIAMGVFSTAIANSGFLGVVQLQLQSIANVLGIFSVVLLPLLVIVASLIGIHPFISILLVGQVLASLQLPVAPVTTALCLALGGSISYMASPFAGVILTLAKYVNCTTRDIAFRWNWRFCSVFFIEGILFAYVWGRM